MIDRVELQRILGYVIETEKRERKKDLEEGKEVEVSLSEVAKARQSVNYEDIQRKVEKIKQEMARGSYEVDPQKVLKGIEKYLSSK